MKVNNIQNYQYHNYYTQNRKQNPSFESRGTTEVIGDFPDVEKIEEIIDNNPQARDFFERYDGYIRLSVNDEKNEKDPNTYYKMQVIYKHPLKPKKEQVYLITQATSHSAQKCLKYIIFDITGDKSLLSLQLGSLNYRMQKELETHEAKQAAKQNRWYNKLLRKLKLKGE